MWVVWCASRISACSPTSRTQSAESCACLCDTYGRQAASRKPRASSMRVIAWVIRLVMVKCGLKLISSFATLYDAMLA